MTRHPARGGFALPVTLVLLLALASVAWVVLQSGREAHAVARAALAGLQARLAAEGGVRRVTSSWDRATFHGLATGDTTAIPGRMLPGGTYGTVVRRVDGETFVLVGEGRGAGGWGSVRIGRVVWSLDPPTRLRSHGAVVEHAGTLSVAPGSRIGGDSVSVHPAGWGPACTPLQPVVDSLFPSASALASAGWTPPPPPVPPPPGTSPFPALGLLAFADLVAGADVSATGTSIAGPGLDLGSGCAGLATGSWGTPTAPGGACGGFRPLVTVDGALHLAGGEGQGVLAVSGDLRLSGTVYFAGLVLVGGSLVVEGDATIVGFVRAWSDVETRDRAHIEGSACAALAALAAPAFEHPLPVPGGSWIWPF